jgi:TP901 family phage tail tape measure protein
MTRVGASQVFFNVVAGFNARKLIQDHRTTMNVMRAVSLDSFEAMLKPIEDVTRAIGVYVNELKQVSIEMDKAQVEFEKFYSGDDAAELAERLKDVGIKYAKVGTEALAAGSRAAQVAAIVGEENIPLLVEQAEILSNISDLNSEEAMKGIIKLQQQTGVLYGDLNEAQFQRLTQLQKEKVLTDNSAKALDTLNTIANRSVAVEGELVETMTNFAAQGALVGEQFESMAAMSAVLLEAGEEAGAAGRALRMIFARMGGDIGGARTELEAMGVEVMNSQGEMNTLTDVIQQLVDMGWHNMSSAQKQNIAQTIAGNRHYVRFIKLMENQERVVKLSADALNDIDSAAGQAEKAMQSFAYTLESAEATGENLKANLGESLSPFLIGQQKARNDLLEMQTIFADIFGPGFLEAMGRMTTFMQHAGGFVKFGLGIQSLAIGMSMFDSVQRDLQGILIANETLHSKQATYFDFNVQATKNEKVILQGIQHTHQVINRHRERSAALQQKINHLQTVHKSSFDEQNRLEEYSVSLDEQSLNAQKELNSLSSMYNHIANEGSGNRMQRVLYYNEQLKGMNSEMTLEKQFNRVFVEKSAAQEAHMRRMVIQHTEVNRLNKRDVEFLIQKNNNLKKSNDAINTIIQAETILDATRAKTFTGGGVRNLGNQASHYNAITVASRQLSDAMAENKIQVTDYEKRLANVGGKMDNLRPKEQERLQYFRDEARMYKSLEIKFKEYQTAYETGTEAQINLTDQQRAALYRLGETTLGHQMQTDRVLKTVDMHGMMVQRQVDITSALDIIEKEQLLTKKQMLDILDDLGPVNQQLTDFTEELRQSQDELNDSTDRRIQLEEILKNGLADTATETIELKRKLDEDGLIAANVKASDSARKFGFALSSVASVALPMFSQNANGAVAATVMMSTTLIPAISSLGKTTKEFIQFQRELIQANKAAGLSWKAYTGKLVKAYGPLIAITGALAIFNSKQEKSAKALEVAQNFAMEHDATLLELQSNTHLFSGENEYLAKKLGITNHSLKELRKDSDLLDETIFKLERGMDGLDGSQEAAVDSALRLADALQAINTGAATLNDEMIDVSYATIDEAYDGISELGNTLDETALRIGFDYGGERIDAGSELVDAGLFSDDAIEKHYARAFGFKKQIGVDVDFEQLFAELQDMHERGERLSKSEIKALGVLIDDAEIYGAIVAINNSILTDTSEAGIFGNDGADQAQENIQTIARDLQNLTEDVYDFGTAREELFFGGRYGNVTGSLYKQVVKQGVGVLYNKMDIIQTNNFNGFFNEIEAADRIRRVLNEIAPSLSNA